MKVINPIENYNTNHISEIEKTVDNFYSLVESSSAEKNDKLREFSNVDLESHFSEEGELKFDLASLLSDN